MSWLKESIAFTALNNGLKIIVWSQQLRALSPFSLPASQQIIVKRARAPFINSMIMYLTRKPFLISRRDSFLAKNEENITIKITTCKLRMLKNDRRPQLSISYVSRGEIDKKIRQEISFNMRGRNTKRGGGGLLLRLNCHFCIFFHSRFFHFFLSCLACRRKAPV